MAKPHERVFALVAAVLFFASSVGVSIFVILQMRNEHKIAASETAGVSNTNQSSANSSTQNKPTEKTVLEGTKLQDFTSLAKIDKLQAKDTVVGTGEEVKAGATVTAHYTGALAKDGTIFQSSHDGKNQPVQFPLTSVIAGWTQGVPGMKVGGTRRLFIPAQLAYGAQSPAANIPANSDLVFDIEITAVTNK